MGRLFRQQRFEIWDECNMNEHLRRNRIQILICTWMYHWYFCVSIHICYTIVILSVERCCDHTVASLITSYRQWKSRATISHISFSSLESARMMRDCTSAGWRELTTERLWITKLKPGWRLTLQPDHDGYHPLPTRRAPRCTWQTRSQESPARLWATITWVQTRGWIPPLPLTLPPTKQNRPPAQVRPWQRLF